MDAWAHPRSRGENIVEQADPISPLGSSPLTRGKLQFRPSASRAGRLIPAHAGKTQRRDDGRRRDEAHPRSRGENPSTLPRCIRRIGSSPLTRGKLPSRQPFQFSLRLIPAHAGKTTRRYLDRCGSAAHPRSRGENISATLISRPERGSSPLTRGKPICGAYRDGDDGLIPAHAGKTAPCLPRA